MADQAPSMWPFLQNIGLMLTYKCQVSCPHCIVECSPHRTEEMQESDALDWIGQIAHYRNGYIKVLSLTGGEPLFDIGKFRRVAECAASHGLLTAAVTNAYWATDPDRAAEVLRSIPPLAALSISTDSYREMPLEQIFDRAEVNPVLHALRVWGPAKLVELARAAGLQAELPSEFVEGNVCDACYRIFSRPALAPFLNGLVSDAEFARVTAYARVYYLKEDEMADRLFGNSVPA